MIVEDKFVISAPLEETWNFLLDIPRVSQCIPGAGEIEQVDEGTYKGNLVVKVGPIGANFAGQVQLADLDPPHHLSATARAKDQATASIASIDFSAALSPGEAEETEVAFKVDVTIRGRLGQFGHGVIRETAKQMTQVFAECVQAQLVQQVSDVHATKGAGGTQSTGPATYPEAAAPAPQVAPKTPSLIVILIKSIASTFANWLRSLRAS